MTESPGIWIITEEVTETTPEEGSKSIRRSYDDPYADVEQLRTTNRQRTRITSTELKNNMSEFLEVVEEAFETAEKPKSQMRLEELELSIEINAEGQVSLLVHRSQKYEVVMSVVLPLPKVRGFKNEMCLIFLRLQRRGCISNFGLFISDF